MNRKLNLLHITTVPLTLGFLHGQVSYMKDHGFDVYAISSPGELLDEFGSREQITVSAVMMPRTITPLSDIAALGKLWSRLRIIRPHIVHSHTPKGGLLGMIAAYFAGIPIRIYNIHGMPYMTASGFRRRILKFTEKVSCLLAHQVLCVSHSIREVAISDSICPPDKIKVIGGGSINGIDSGNRFNPETLASSRSNIRREYGIPDNAIVIGFVGRIVRDKGIVELAEAWKTIADRNSNVYLMLIGPFEPQDQVPPETVAILEGHDRIVLAGMCKDTAPYYAAMDIVVLPTYREGFPVVPMEAAAMGLPVVATKIPGCIDAIQDGVTGTLVPPQQSDALAEAIQRYLDDPELREKHGKAGRERVVRDFRQEDIWEAIYQEYMRLLKEKGLDIPVECE